MHFKTMAGLGLALAISATSAHALTPVTSITSFEGSTISVGDYGYSADETGKWFATGHPVATLPGVTFSGMAGLQVNSPAWGFPNAPDGTTTAFLQSYGGETNGAVTVNLSGLGLKAGETYDLVFYTAGRPATGAPTFSVSYDGHTTPFAAPSTSGFTREVFNFTADGGSSVTFAAMTGKANDASFALDNLGLTVPEPATWMMMLIGFGGLGAVLRANRRRAIVPA